MPPKTRKTKTEDDVEETETEDLKPTPLPESDQTFERKFIIGKSIANSKIIKLRHPKEGSALFRISKNDFDEVLCIDDGNRSWFYGESVIENGQVYLLAPYNPIFVCLPYLYATKQKFLEIDEILKDSDAKELRENVRVVDLLENVADVKEAIDTKVYRLNEEKMLQWISARFEILKEELKDDVHKSLLDCEDAYNRYVFNFLCDYLSTDIAQLTKQHLNIKEAEKSENIDMSMKRKMIDEEDEYVKPVVKKPRESIAAKKLQAASKGTKSISSFFAKK